MEGMSLRGNYSEGYRSGDLSEGCGYRKSKRRCNLPSSTKVGRVLTCDWYSTQTDWNASALCRVLISQGMMSFVWGSSQNT